MMASKPARQTNAPLMTPVLVAVFAILMPALASGPSWAVVLRESAKVKVVDRYGRLPMIFEANQGQTSAEAKFVARGAGYNLRVSAREAVLQLRNPSSKDEAKDQVQAKEQAILRMRLLGGNEHAQAIGEEMLPGKSNYFVGNDASKWVTNVPQFAKVRFRGVYPGVDLVYYGHRGEFEHDFVVRPGADPGSIRLAIEGASQIRIEQGNLKLSASAADVQFRQPFIYQEVNGRRHGIEGRYVLRNGHEVGFEIANYDHSRKLIIDPVLAYSTYLQGAEGGRGVAVDAQGNAYVAGMTDAFDQAPILHRVAYVSKVNADGTAVLYTAYLGGSIDEDLPSIAIDTHGNAYVAGTTLSPDFPTVNPIQATNHGCTDAFLTKINSQGSGLVYSTYLGGSFCENAGGVAVDASGRAYVVGGTSSADFPTANALQPSLNGPGGVTGDAFVTKVNAAGTALIYSTYLGGSDGETASGIAIDGADNAYVTGTTTSTDFPTVHAFQTARHGDGEAFVCKINSHGTALVYSTYLGGSGSDNGLAIALDSARNIYVAGATQSTDFPIMNAMQPNNGGRWDLFVTKLNATGSKLVYSTYLGGSGAEWGMGYNTGAAKNLAVDALGDAFVTGGTESSDFPVLNPLQAAGAGYGDAFVAELGPTGAMVYATYLGGVSQDYAAGIAVDSAGSAFVTGNTFSYKFPATPAAPFTNYVFYTRTILAKIAPYTAVGVSPAQLTFNGRLVGNPSPARKVSYSNKGATAVQFNRIYFVGANAGDFAETDTCGTSLAPGAACNVSVTFTPAIAGLRKGALAFSDSDPGSPHAIALTGTGTFLAEAPGALAFGAQAVSTASVPQSITLTNTGGSAVSFYSIRVTGPNAGDFSLSNGCGTMLAAGTSCMVSVTFKPAAAGTRQGGVYVGLVGGANPAKLALSGNGF